MMMGGDVLLLLLPTKLQLDIAFSQSLCLLLDPCNVRLINLKDIRKGTLGRHPPQHALELVTLQTGGSKGHLTLLPCLKESMLELLNACLLLPVMVVVVVVGGGGYV
jgi:hypothetical protein